MIDVLALARQAGGGFTTFRGGSGPDDQVFVTFRPEALSCFAALLTAAVREEDARIADYMEGSSGSPIGRAIRAQKETP